MVIANNFSPASTVCGTTTALKDPLLCGHITIPSCWALPKAETSPVAKLILALRVVLVRMIPFSRDANSPSAKPSFSTRTTLTAAILCDSWTATLFSVGVILTALPQRKSEASYPERDDAVAAELWSFCTSKFAALTSVTDDWCG